MQPAGPTRRADAMHGAIQCVLAANDKLIDDAHATARTAALYCCSRAAVQNCVKGWKKEHTIGVYPLPLRPNDPFFEEKIQGEADAASVTPGIGDEVPLAEEYRFLKPALQFKSVALASHRKTVMVGMQEDQARFFGNAALMVAMGIFVYWMKSLETQNHPSGNMSVWLADGFDRSGVISLAM